MAMNALSLYVTTCRMIFQSDIEDNGAWADINRLVLYLRQALTCCVCGKLLTVPMSSTVSSCQHHVCKTCVGGKMRLKPSCSWCKDHSKFIENTQLRILLQCYNRLCEFMTSASMNVKWGSLASGSASGTNMSFAELVQEGVQLMDRFNFAEPPSLRGYSRQSAVTTTRVTPAQQTGQSTATPRNGQAPQTSNKSTSTGVSNVMNGTNSNSGDSSTNKSSTSLLGNSSSSSSVSCSSSVLKETPAKTTMTTTDIVSTPAKIDSSGNQSNTVSVSVGSHAILTNGSSLIRNSTPSSSTTTTTTTKVKAKRRGCRCGLATPNPGKLTCCGQRCPCYVDGKGCFECKCRGCRNPHKANANSSGHPKSNVSHGHTTSTSTSTSAPPQVPVTVNVSTSIINPTLTSSATGTLSPNLCSGSSLLPISRSINIVSSPGSTSDTFLPFFKLGEEDPIVSDVEMDP